MLDVTAGKILRWSSGSAATRTLHSASCSSAVPASAGPCIALICTAGINVHKAFVLRCTLRFENSNAHAQG